MVRPTLSQVRSFRSVLHHPEGYRPSSSVTFFFFTVYVYNKTIMYTNEEAIRITSDLIRIRSTKDNEEGRKDAVDYVKRYFEGEGVFMKEFKKDGVYSVVVTLKKEKNPYLFLNGHLDVVLAKDEQFMPRVEGDKLFGRGSGDMKGGCAVMMMIMKELSRRKKKPSVGLMLTTDEEIGGKNGAGFLVNEKGYRSELLIVPDGGKDLHEIIVNQKGILHVKIKAHGKSAHGSRPFLGENAIEKVFEYYREIQKVIPPLKSSEWKNSVNLGKIEGGKSVNAVPDYAEMHLDIRVTKKGEKEKLFKKIQKITGGNVEIIAEGEPFVQSEKHPLVKKYVSVAKRHKEKGIRVARVEGASDARFFSAQNVPTIITKINCENIHGDNEWISIGDMEKFHNIVTDLVDELKI